MHRHLLLAGLLCGVLWTTRAVVGQDTPDAKGLTDQLNPFKKENELLKKEIELLKKENELLKKENALLKKDAKAKPDGVGDRKTGTKSRTKASRGGIDYELVKCVRNSSHPRGSPSRFPHSATGRTAISPAATGSGSSL